MTYSFPDESCCQGPFPAGSDLRSYHYYVGTDKQYTHTHTVDGEGAIVSTVEASQYSAQTNPPPSYLQPEGPHSGGNSIRQTLPLLTYPGQNHFFDVILTRSPAATSARAGASQEPGDQVSCKIHQSFVAL